VAVEDDEEPTYVVPGCQNLRDWTADEIDGPEPFRYIEGEKLVFDMDAVSPDCTVDYQCKSVTREDDEEHELFCSDFMKGELVDDEESFYLIANYYDY